MSLHNKKKIKFISIDELIQKAKEKGVDFGKGNPRNRLRYYTKIGLLPHAQRKVFPGEKLPKGAYPEYVLNLLIEIDRKLKQGKTVRDLKRELEGKQVAQFQQNEELFQKPQKFFQKKKKIEFLPTRSTKFLPKVVLPELLAQWILAGILIILVAGIIVSWVFAGKGFTSLLTATLGKYVAQIPSEKEPPKNTYQIFPTPPIEPYLTINAETQINGPLKVSDFVQTPRLEIINQGITASFGSARLTQSRTYILPDQSGTICLSTGNCFGIFGEVTATKYEKGRLARFLEGRRIESSSIVDLYNKGIALVIDNEGRIGIGTQTPQFNLDVKGTINAEDLIKSAKIEVKDIYIEDKLGIGKENPETALDVEGKIQATGDICTKLGGGKCLSELSTTPQIPFVISTGSQLSGSGTANKIALWTSGDTLSSSIITQANDNIGIDIDSPQYKLDVGGTVQVQGFKMPSGAQDGYVLMSDSEGVGTWQELPSISLPSGLIGQTLRHDGTNWVADSFLYNTGDKIGIGTTTPTTDLDVAGTVKMTGFQLTTGAQAGYILTSDANGVGSWQPPPSGTLPSGTETGQTLRWDGSGWLPNSFLFNTGSAVGIGTNAPTSTLTVVGEGLFQGTLTVTTTNLPQLLLSYDPDSYLNFSIQDTQSQISASHTLIIDSLTGEIRMGNNVTLLNASSAVIQGQTFQSAANDSTVRKSGELVFRQAIPIFRYPVPAQTQSTTFVRVSKYIDQSLDTLPPVLPGATRTYAFLINFVDDIPTTDVSTWRVYQPSANQVVTTFSFVGQNKTNFEEGFPYLSPYINNLPTSDWQLEVEVPAGYKIRIFNIFLLVYDQIS